jgi:hypothetical protein
MTLPYLGHSAEAGIWKATSTLYFAKLAQLFEPESMTLVHGFDWFRARARGQDAEIVFPAPISRPWSGSASWFRFRARPIVQSHLDLTGSARLLRASSASQFKLVFLDCGY